MMSTLTHCLALWRLVGPVSCALAVNQPVLASETTLTDPVASRNLSPLYANLGIPVMTSAVPLASGELIIDWTVHWASHSVVERAGEQTLSLDGETRRQDLRVQLGLGSGVALSLNLPYISHNGGQLDTFIDDWHAFWGMPDGPRAFQPSNELQFAYTGAPHLNLDSSRSSFGDAELALSLAVASSERWTLGVFAQYKFASGDIKDFSGSGDRGVSLGARWSRQSCVFAKLSCHLQAGWSELGASQIDRNAETWGPFAGLSVAWAMNGSFSLLAQIDTHDVVYDATLLSTNGAPVWGTVGLRWQPGQRWMIDAQFVEDLAVGTAPDIAFRFAVSRSL